MGIKLRFIEKIESKKVKQSKVKSNKIGVYLQRFRTGEKNCASDRIRGEWIIKNNNNFELYQDDVDYDAVVFHIATDAISQTSGFKVLDLCDAVWRKVPKFFETIDPIDLIIVSTQGLKDELSKLTNKKIVVIDDGHDLEYYQTRIKNEHKRIAKEVVWFGYAQNSGCLAPFLRTIKENGLKLKAIAQSPIPPLDKADFFVKWDVDTCIEEISKADFAVLPFNGKLKSNNKDITAYLSGIPVAKTEEDIKRLIKPGERKKDLEKSNAYQYDVKNIAEKYYQTIRNEMASVTAYSSICGGFDAKRDDILIFDQEESFKRDVMNAKIYKVLSHKFIKSRISIWVDGNIYIKDTHEFAELLGDADIAVFKHPYRKNIYQEHEEAKKRLPKELKTLIDNQIEDYKSEGMPDFPLAECGVIIRKESPIVEEFNLRWWAEICKYQHRDQISFPYVWWKMKDRIKIKLLDGNARNHPLLIYEKHKNN